MTTKFVHHICIQTNHYEESLKFYRDILGFELIEESPHFHNRYYNSWLKLGEFYIELQTGKVGENLDRVYPNTQGIHHFCLWVDDLVKEVQTIKQWGYDFILKNGEAIYQVENGCLCKLIAPEGTIIELRDNRGI
ncbi:VOC family protein [Ammoniphilus sp. CFH 90114]|uniref:VOC family protein n=1 Tax=Ammoniphilus sp. CFH 90114 TaxID=2493665 RepID=UPI00100DEA84|nr:VOC family protein [Ammoniphilus sp. CFH 90114]RXT07049.1 VOC family protein [Ammoniphilus sp. CFH 90114]